MKDKIRQAHIDWVVAIWGVISWAVLFVCDSALNYLACRIFFVYVPAMCGLVYLGVYLYTGLTKGPKFDWYLANGNFLGKVISFVILTPFILLFFIKTLDLSLDAYNLIQPDSEELTESVVTEDVHKEDNLFWTIFVHFIDPGLQIEADKSGTARNWSAVIALLGLFLMNGLLITSIIDWIGKRKENWVNGETRYSRYFTHAKSPHYVIIGGNDLVPGIVRQLLASDGESDILIQTSQEVAKFRVRLFASLTDEQQRRIVIYHGDRTSAIDIEELKPDYARELYLIGEDSRADDFESYHDTLNMKCLQLIKDYCRKSRTNNKLLCRVMFEYQTTFSVFQFSEISSDIKDFIDFKPFNYYEMWAQKVLISKELNVMPTSGYLPIEGVDGIDENSDEYVHLVIVGMSRMGTAMAVEAAHLAHYPNFETKHIRTKITFIDVNAKQEKNFFMGRFKELFELSNWRYGAVTDSEPTSLVWECCHRPKGYDYLGGDFLDIEWEFVNGGIEDSSVQKYLVDSSRLTSKMTVAMCVPEANKCLAHALYLDKEIYERAQQILVYNRYDDALVEEIIDHKNNQYNPFCNKIKAFGMGEYCYASEQIRHAEYIASVLGNEYSRIRKMLVETGKLVDMGAKGMAKSKVAGWWSEIYSANMLWTKLRCAHWDGASDDLTDKQLDIISKVEHNRWVVEQLIMRCRPATQEEQKAIIKDRTLQNGYKGRMIHFDICSNARLVEIDEPSVAYDRGFSEVLPRIYKELSNEI